MCGSTDEAGRGEDSSGFDGAAGLGGTGRGLPGAGGSNVGPRARQAHWVGAEALGSVDVLQSMASLRLPDLCQSA